MEHVNLKGRLAFCSLGCLGIITEELPRIVKYPSGAEGLAYVGVHLTDKIAPIGSPWCSRVPRVVGEIGPVQTSQPVAYAISLIDGSRIVVTPA